MLPGSWGSTHEPSRLPLVDGRVGALEPALLRRLVAQTRPGRVLPVDRHLPDGARSAGLLLLGRLLAELLEPRRVAPGTEGTMNAEAKAVKQRSVLRMIHGDLQVQPALATSIPCLITLFCTVADNTDTKRRLAILKGLRETCDG